MIVQVLAKASAAERWNKRIIWAVQDVLYDFIVGTTSLRVEDLGADWSQTAHPILLFIYSLDTSSADGYQLGLTAVKGGNKTQLAQVLESSAVVPTQVLQDALDRRILNGQNVFDLTEDPQVKLGKVAEELVERKEKGEV